MILGFTISKKDNTELGVFSDHQRGRPQKARRILVILRCASQKGSSVQSSSDCVITNDFPKRGKWTWFQGEAEMLESKYVKRKGSLLPLANTKWGPLRVISGMQSTIERETENEEGRTQVSGTADQGALFRGVTGATPRATGIPPVLYFLHFHVEETPSDREGGNLPDSQDS